MGFLTDLLSGAGGWVAAALGGIVALLLTYFRGKSSGKEQEKAEHNEVINKQATEARQEVRNVQKEVDSKDDDAVRNALESEWVRNPAGKGRG